MKLAIMQPYFFPYLGYFQLIHAVDEFVVYDSAQYIKGGWVNRNRILVKNTPKIISLPLQKDRHCKSINQRGLAEGQWQHEKKKVLTTLHQTYAKAPFYNQAMPVFEMCLSYEQLNLADFITFSLRHVAEYLSIRTPLVMASDMSVPDRPTAQAKVISMCQLAGADHYINSIGGRELYSSQAFKDNNLRLSFLRPGLPEYPQFQQPFVPGLSIIDVMMFNAPSDIRRMLRTFSLESA